MQIKAASRGGIHNEKIEVGHAGAFLKFLRSNSELVACAPKLAVSFPIFNSDNKASPVIAVSCDCQKTVLLKFPPVQGFQMSEKLIVSYSLASVKGNAIYANFHRETSECRQFGEATWKVKLWVKVDNVYTRSYSHG